MKITRVLANRVERQLGKLNGTAPRMDVLVASVPMVE